MVCAVEKRLFQKYKTLIFLFFSSAPHLETPLLDQHPRTRGKGKGKSYQTCPSDFTFVLEGAPFGAVASLGEQTSSPSCQYNPPCLPRVLGVKPGSCAPGPARIVACFSEHLPLSRGLHSRVWAEFFCKEMNVMPIKCNKNKDRLSSPCLFSLFQTRAQERPC